MWTAVTSSGRKVSRSNGFSTLSHFRRGEGHLPPLVLSRGFTILELLIVVLIIGILAALAIVNALTALDKARQKATMADMRTLSVMMDAYNMNENHYPRQGVDFNTLDELQNILMQYVPVNSPPPMQDRWHHDYHYTNDADGQHYKLESYGKDGKDGPQDISPGTAAHFDYDIIIDTGQFVASPTS